MTTQARFMGLFSALVFVAGALGCSGEEVASSPASSAGNDAGLVDTGEMADSGTSSGEPDAATEQTDVSHSSDSSDMADASYLTDSSSGADSSMEADAEVFAPPFARGDTLGGPRSARVILPSNYTTTRRWPMVVMLHGYSATAEIQESYFRLGNQVDEYGFILVLPQGTRDMSGNRFWNATPACCDHYGSDVDDVGYLRSILNEAQRRLAVDAARVYFVGHSNGGFMSHRMACEAPEAIAAIASLAGPGFIDPEDCSQPGKVAVLQMHGTLDLTVRFQGGSFFNERYPGAQATAEQWRTRNGCSIDSSDRGRMDADSLVLGSETAIERWEGCDEGMSVELWTMHGSGHTPLPTSEFVPGMLDFLWSHSR